VILAVALAGFLLVFGGVGILAIRRPLLARLALREAIRRRAQSALVVLGLMIGAAGITASLVGADSSRDSAILNGYRTWGMVDLTVTAGDRSFSIDVAHRLAEARSLRSLLDGVQAGVEMVGSVADLDRRQGEPAVRLIGFEPRTQRPFGAYVLADGRRTFGNDLVMGEVLISRQLAGALSARVGDRLRFSVEQAEKAPPVDVTVAGVARSVGPGAYGLRAAVFAPLETAQRVAATDEINIVRISARGGREAGVVSARRAVPALQAEVRRLGGALFRVRQVKATEIEQAEKSTEFSRAMLVGLSALIVAAGVALVVNLVLMLAEERRPRLAVMRALGLKRRGLVTMSVIEGAIYSVVAAAVGVIVGVLAGRIMAVRFARAFAQFFGGEVDFAFVFSVRPSSVAVAFSAGTIITLLTVFLAARRTSRMSIPSAIRDLPEPARERRRAWPRRVGLAVLAAAGVAGVTNSDRATQLLGGIGLIVVAGSLAKPRMSNRIHASAIGGALAVWAFIIVATLTNTSDVNRFFSAFITAILAAVFGLSILAAANLRLVERGAGLIGGASQRLRATLRPPLAYLSRRPLRTGLTTGVFAVVLAIVTLLAVFLSISRPRYERDSVGYDVRVTATTTSSLTLPASLRGQVVRDVAVPTRGYVGPFQSTFGGGETAFVPLFELSDRLLTDPPIRITTRWQDFKTDDDIWRALRDNPRWVISDFANPGDEIVMQGARGPVRFRVAANQQFGVLSGIIATSEALAPFSAAPLGVTLLLDAAPGTDADTLARRVERVLFAKGVDAATTRKLLDDGYRANRTFFSVVEVLMRLGLVVGILSLGIIGLRTVVERRRVIGVLRAIGYRRRGVMAGLMVEAGMTATIGVAVGFVAGAIMGGLFIRQFFEGTPFGLDGASIGTALALVYSAVVLVTLGPAWRASRLPPAEAVRHTE
jgi:putative ABC transport system permease protein